MVFLMVETDLSLLKEFSKKSVVKIFIILFEQEFPEAVVHGLGYGVFHIIFTLMLAAFHLSYGLF